MGGRLGTGGDGGARGRSVILAVAGLVSLIAVSAVPAGSIAAAKSPFEPGLYVGKTSQGHPVRLRLTVTGASGSGHAYLSSADENATIYIEQACASIGTTSDETLFLLDVPVASNGTVHAVEESFSKTVATIKVGHHGTLSGRLSSTGTLEDGAHCDSGNVTFNAKLKS